MAEEEKGKDKEERDVPLTKARNGGKSGNSRRSGKSDACIPRSGLKLIERASKRATSVQVGREATFLGRRDSRRATVRIRHRAKCSKCLIAISVGKARGRLTKTTATRERWKAPRRIARTAVSSLANRLT